MKFEKGLLRRNYGPREVSFFLLLAVTLAGGLFAILSDIPARAIAALQPPSPTVLPSAPVTTPMPSAHSVQSPTAISVLETGLPTLMGLLPTPIPTATWFYQIPARPTPIPTPVLPSAAPFPFPVTAQAG